MNLLQIILMTLMFPKPTFGAGGKYVGAMGGIATLSADAGSQSVAQGLSLSSYAPSNGGALDLFAGADVREYFSVQGDFIWNRNRLRLNSSSSAAGTFYQEDRRSSNRRASAAFSFISVADAAGYVPIWLWEPVSRTCPARMNR